VCAGCEKARRRFYGKRWRRVRDLDCGDREVYLDFQMRRVKCPLCGVKNERLAFLSDNTRFTLRFALKVGALCRVMTIRDVARHMRMDWHAVKELDKIYMREQLRLAGSATLRPNGRSGSAVTGAAKRTWIGFMRFWARKTRLNCASP